MNGRDFQNSVLEGQEFDARRKAQLEHIYETEKAKYSKSNNSNCNTKPACTKVCISTKPAGYVENEIHLTDSQFREFMHYIKSVIK